MVFVDGHVELKTARDMEYAFKRLRVGETNFLYGDGGVRTYKNEVL